MQKVTTWYRQNPDGSWNHNHLENGWAVDLTHPTAINAHQKTAWANKRWKAVYAFQTSAGLVSEKAACVAALKMSNIYSYVPTDDVVKQLEGQA